MEKERTINQILSADIHRITREQISALIEIISAEIRNKTVMGIANVLDRNGHFELTHGAFKGNFENGTNRRAYAEAQFIAAGIKPHEEAMPDHKTYALI